MHFWQLLWQLFKIILNKFAADIFAAMVIMRNMKKPSVKNEPTGYPEFGVRKEYICAFFSPPMPSSTFHDRVNDGIIVPLKGMRGFYKLRHTIAESVQGLVRQALFGFESWRERHLDETISMPSPRNALACSKLSPRNPQNRKL